jgi:hypothetical protein
LDRGQVRHALVVGERLVVVLVSGSNINPKQPESNMPNSMDRLPATRVRVCAAKLDFLASEPILVSLAHVDLIVRSENATIDPLSACASTSAEDLLAVGVFPDVLVGADAGSLRMQLPFAAIQEMPWISLAKVSYGVNSSANSHALPNLVNQYGVSAALLKCAGYYPRNVDAMSEASAAALVFAAMLADGVPLRRQLLLSQVITAPYLPLPTLDDDIGWRYVPDDVLLGLQVCSNYGFPDDLVAKACAESRRRAAAGHKPDLAVRNWHLPGVEPYRPEDSYGQD